VCKDVPPRLSSATLFLVAKNKNKTKQKKTQTGKTKQKWICSQTEWPKGAISQKE